MKRNNKRVLITVTAAIALSSILISTVISATPNGDTNYIHGVVNANMQTYGKITSTEMEDSMYIKGKAYYLSGPNEGSTINYSEPESTDTYAHSLYISHGATKGSSYFYYYVNDVKEHESTAWWNFDFT